MAGIFSDMFRWVAWKALTLLLIVFLLLGLAWLKKELQGAVALRNDRKALVVEDASLAKQVANLRQDLEEGSKTFASDLEHLHREKQELEEKKKNLPWKEWILNAVARKELNDGITRARDQIKEREKARREWEAARRTTIREKEIEQDRITRQIAIKGEELEKSFLARTLLKAREVLPAAMWILAGIILIPVAIKVFFYFVIAPWAAGRPPIRILPTASGHVRSGREEGMTGNVGKNASGVSLPIVLGDDQELLLKPEYLQSTSQHARKSTKWFLNSEIPVASLLSGMFMLTRISPAGAERVVISSTRDSDIEFGVIDLAEDAAFVCQPRCLVGVVQDRRNPMRITRHWRLGSLQSWLTLQLRFLVFHGPAQLVVKGCRGVRVESVGTGRLINQAATLGFSADLAYANTRCETFMSYWTGKEDLFNDLFTGDSGAYAYEEVPSSSRRAGVMGRGLEGFTDSVLKVFGI